MVLSKDVTYQIIWILSHCGGVTYIADFYQSEYKVCVLNYRLRGGVSEYEASLPRGSIVYIVAVIASTRYILTVSSTAEVPKSNHVSGRCMV